MKKIENQSFDEERALYNSDSIIIKKCKFDGPKDGESAIKESKNIKVEDSYFNLRYPFWHNENLDIDNSFLTDKCRAAIWYSNNIKVSNSNMLGIKVFRECSNIHITNSNIESPEAFWFTNNVTITNSKADSMYFLQRSKEINISELTFKGKYSFQYTNNVTIKNSFLDTKDAFWHSDNVYVENSTVKGEYLGWYSNGLTFKNCTIVGTQPLCYATNLKIIDCTFVDADLAFEYSEIEATIKGEIKSIKNPKSGNITADKIGEIIIMDSKFESTCKIETKK